jgi:hypothetical protein
MKMPLSFAGLLRKNDPGKIKFYQEGVGLDSGRRLIPGTGKKVNKENSYLIL